MPVVELLFENSQISLCSSEDALHLLLLFLKFFDILLAQEVSERELANLNARSQNVAYAWMTLIYVEKS